MPSALFDLGQGTCGVKQIYNNIAGVFGERDLYCIHATHAIYALHRIVFDHGIP